MRWRLEGAGEALHSPIPWVALTAALALAAAGWIALERSRVDEARSQFERRTETAEAAIRSRMLSYEQILRSGAARIASSPSISRQEWRDFIAHLGLEERFPGIQAQQPGFVMYVPVYGKKVRAATPDERNEALAGFVFSPFRMHDLMRGILDDGVLQVLDMQVFDEPAPRAATELIDTRTAWRVTPAEAEPAFSRQVAFPMPGRVWTIQFISRPEFDATLQRSRPWGVLGAGILASIVLFFLTVALVAAWNRAHHLSMRDPLTGLYNRRYLEETMRRELPRARRMGESVGVIVLDIDHFKNLNDTFGHDAGDFVLERTGELLRAT